MRRVWYIIMLLALLGSCRKAGTEQREMAAEFVGKQIEFPEGLKYQIQDTPIDLDPHYGEWKIVAYIDSTGCITCRMKLSNWNEIISEFQSGEDTEVSFLMIIDSSKEDNILNNLERENFLHPVCIDREKNFVNANQLPKESKYHCVLLNYENKVVAVGNPVTNPKIREKFRMEIFGHNRRRDQKLCSEPTVTIGAVNPGDTIVKVFTLTNNSDKRLTLQELVSSCECTETSMVPDILNQGESGTVTMIYIADTISGPISRYADLFFYETDNPERLTLYGFITNHKR